MKTLLVLLLSTVAALAQPAQQSPIEQALSGRLWNEINGSLQCNATVIGAAKQIEELQAKVKDLEGQLAEAKPPAKTGSIAK